MLFRIQFVLSMIQRYMCEQSDSAMDIEGTYPCCLPLSFKLDLQLLTCSSALIQLDGYFLHFFVDELLSLFLGDKLLLQIPDPLQQRSLPFLPFCGLVDTC